MTAAAGPGAAAEPERARSHERFTAAFERIGARATLSDVLLWWAVAAGVLLRLVQYLDNRSLWLDESFLALNILEKSTSALLGELDYEQAAPPGFLVLEKLATAIFGDSEYALRLLPLIAGIASMFLFRAAARRFLTGGPLLLAVLLFAVNEPLVYYASEVKPYSSDVAIALALLLLACLLIERADERVIQHYVVLAVAGTVAVWFSYPAVFVLVAILIALFLPALGRAPWRRVALISTLGLAWFLSFIGVYIVTLRNTSRIADAIFGSGQTDKGLKRLPGVEAIQQAWGLFVDPVGFEHGTNGLAALVFCFGVFALIRCRDDLQRTALWTLPLAAAFGAAVFDLYPLSDRFSLFLAPFVLVIVARGVQEISTLSPFRPLILAMPIAVLLVLPPVAGAAANLIDPPTREHVRPLLGELVEEVRNGDMLYVYRNAQYALRYYGECADCDAWEGEFPWPLRPSRADPGERALESVPPTIAVAEIDETDQVGAALDELERLPRNTRIWFLFSHVTDHEGLNEEALVLAYLNRNGRQLAARATDGASLYLYELTQPAR